MKIHGHFDAAGNFLWEIDSDHIDATFSANGLSVVNHFYTTRFAQADDVTINPDGTITVVSVRVGHLTLIQGAATDLGRFVYELTFDPVTGQELSFTILSHSGQIGGIWSGPPYFDPTAFCALLTP